MIGSLTEVANLERRIAPELVLDSQVPLIVDCGLDLGIPNAQQGSRVTSIGRCRAGCPRGSAHNAV